MALPIISQEQSDLFHRVRDACVDIDSISYVNDEGIRIFLGAKGVGAFINPSCGTGYILTAAHVVLLNPGLARDPPAQYQNFARNQIIFVTVFNVNGTGKSFKYMSTIIGVDRINDIALLKIIPTPNVPEIKCHPHLEFGSSRETKIGALVYTIGNIFRQDAQSFASGIVRDNRFVFMTSPLIAECVSCTIPAGPGNSGGPLLDDQGRIIGVITNIFLRNEINPDLTIATAEVAIKEILEQLLDPTIEHVECIPDQFQPLKDCGQSQGSQGFYRRIPVTLGIDGTYFTPVVSLYNFVTQDFDLSRANVFNQMIGFLVGDEYYQPLSLAGIISPGDLIVKVNGKSIGIYGHGQTSIGQALLPVKPGSDVVIHYRKYSENYNCVHKAQVQVNALPISLDIDPNEETEAYVAVSTEIGNKPKFVRA